MKTIEDMNYNLFVTMNNILELPFSDLISAEKCDNIYNYMYSMLPVAKITETKSESEIADMLISLFYPKWENDYQIAIMPLNDLLENYSEIITENETIDNDVISNNTENRLNKVSGFNSDDFKNNENDINTNTGNTANDTQREKTITKTGKNDYLGNIEKYKEYIKKEYLINTVFYDINSVITLSVFE